MDHSINDLTVMPLHATKHISILAGDLGRETPASAEEGSNFYDHFAAWDDNFSPRSVINVRVLDTVMVTSRFKLRTSDTGTTLKVYIHIPVDKVRYNFIVCVSCLLQYIINIYYYTILLLYCRLL